MKRGREQEHEADLVEQPARAIRVEVDRDARRREDVGGTDARGDRAVSVLGNARSRAGCDDGGRDRQVEHVPADPARAVRVENGRTRGRDPSHPCAQGRHRSGDFVGRLAAGRDSDQDRSLLRLRRLAVHEVAEDPLGEIARQRTPRGHDLQRLGDVRSHGRSASRSAPRPATSMKFASSFSPSGVRTDSGWNCTP